MFFRCKNCGGNAVFSPLKGKMYCSHCEGIDSEERAGEGKSTECANCGAQLTIQEYNSTCKCEYCDSYVIIDERVNGNYLPNLVLPFKIDKSQVVTRLQEEFKRKIFTPGSFLSESTLEDMKGMYVPFWMYDYDVNYQYSGQGIKVKVWTSGSTEYTETSYYQIERDMDIDFEKVPVDASIEMKDDVMDLIEPFNYKELEDFQEKYMSGFYGEIYNDSAEALEERAKIKVKNDANALLKGTISGYSKVETKHENLNSSKKTTNYALLPVWRYIYKYRGKNYDFYMNGQTGKIIGSTPVSVTKLLAYSGTVFVTCWIVFSIISILSGVV